MINKSARIPQCNRCNNNHKAAATKTTSPRSPNPTITKTTETAAYKATAIVIDKAPNTGKANKIYAHST